MTTPPTAIGFIVGYPAGAIPLSFVVYLALVRAGARTSRELLYTIASVPGLVILFAWTYFLDDVSGWARWESFVLSSVGLVPTNLLAPLLLIAALIYFIFRKLRKIPSSRITKFDIIVLVIIASAYCYDQIIAIGLQSQ